MKGRHGKVRIHRKKSSKGLTCVYLIVGEALVGQAQRNAFRGQHNVDGRDQLNNTATENGGTVKHGNLKRTDGQRYAKVMENSKLIRLLT